MLINLTILLLLQDVSDEGRVAIKDCRPADYDGTGQVHTLDCLHILGLVWCLWENRET